MSSCMLTDSPHPFSLHVESLRGLDGPQSEAALLVAPEETAGFRVSLRVF